GRPAPESEGGFFGYNSATAKVAELVDALDLGSSAERHVGSSPSFRTNWGQTPNHAGGHRSCHVVSRHWGLTPFFTQQGRNRCSRLFRTLPAPSSATSPSRFPS